MEGAAFPVPASSRFPGRGRTRGQRERRRLKELRSSPATPRWLPSSGSWRRSPRALGKHRRQTTWNLGRNPAETAPGRRPLAGLGTHQRQNRRTSRGSFRRPLPLLLPLSLWPRAQGPPLLAYPWTPCSAPSPNSSDTCSRRQMISRASCFTGDAGRGLRSRERG